MNSLTLRQMQITRLVAQGEPTKKIADLLGISPKTVSNTLDSIYKKLEFRYGSRTTLTLWYLQNQNLLNVDGEHFISY